MTTTNAPGKATLINLDPADLDRWVYRIYSQPRFESLLVTGQDGLVNPRKWDDPFENFFLERTTAMTATGEPVSLGSLGDDWHGQCWSFTSESDAMWRIYSPSPNNGIKVKARLGDLVDNLAGAGRTPSIQCFAGSVRYMDPGQITALMSGLTVYDVAIGGNNARFAELMCVKREAFRHEDEMRLLFNDMQPAIRGSNGVVSYPLDVNTLFKEVELDPRLTEPAAQALRMTLQAAGLKKTVQRSTLYEAPAFVIPLE